MMISGNDGVIAEERSY